MNYDNEKLNLAITSVYIEAKNLGLKTYEIMDVMFKAGIEYMKAENEALEAENKALKDKIQQLTDRNYGN